MKLLFQLAAVAAAASLIGCDNSILRIPAESAPSEPAAETAIPEPATPSLFEQRVSDLSSIRGALEAYKADHGKYPTTEDRWISVVQLESYDWLPDLVPTYLPSAPRDPESVWDFEAPQYVYISNGTGYKLIARKSGDCEQARNSDAITLDPSRSTKDACWAYGYWTEDFAEK